MSNISHIIYCPNIALVTLRNVPFESSIVAEILTAISDNQVNVDMISQTSPLGGNISVAFTISMETMGNLMPVINRLKPRYPELHLEITPGMTKLNFYDANMVNTPGVAANVFSTLARRNIPVTMVTTSTVDISILIPEHAEDTAFALCQETYGIFPEEVAFS